VNTQKKITICAVGKPCLGFGQTQQWWQC